MTTIRDTILRDLDDEIQSVIKVAEGSRLATDLKEYVLTDLLAKQFGDVLSVLVAASRPAAPISDKSGIWVSGFFGSGKSHFAKLVGHLAANTPTSAGDARELFRQRLRPGNHRHDRIEELLQEADNYGLKAQLVPFDITALQGDSTENVGRIFLRALFREVGLSSVITFAELELDIAAAGKHAEFLAAYKAVSGSDWADDRDLPYVSAQFAEAVSQVLSRFKGSDEALRSIEISEQAYSTLSIDDVVKKLARWLDREAAHGRPGKVLFFVADEVGAWAGRDLGRIEGLRALTEAFGRSGLGRLWILATSQERLSDVVQNAGLMDAKATQEFIQRLEARFGTNVHLEPSEVGTVIEDRVLRKKPSARPAVEQLFRDRQASITDFAAKPGLELVGEYPAPSAERFAQDYPFLPYQLTLAADIFGAMRGVKVSSGARSMLKVAFDATRELAEQPVGAVVSWDRIFDAANRDNEFADENYLGTPGLASLERADQDLDDKVLLAPPSRLLKTLWLMQQTGRVPTSVRNLARMLVDRVDVDLLGLEQQVQATLVKLEEHDYVRQDVASGQWRFLTPDEVTVEQIVTEIAANPSKVSAKDVRDQAARLYGERLKQLGTLVMGASSTRFDYGIQLNDTTVLGESAPVQLKVVFASLPQAGRVRDEHAAYVEDSSVYWTVPVPEKLEDRLRRALAIERLKSDAAFNEIRTTKTDVEADKLLAEAVEIRQQAAEDLRRALGQGTLYWGGGSRELNESSPKRDVPAQAAIEEAIADRIALRYPRFTEGDRRFDPRNIDRLLDTTPAKRAGLDPALGLFDADGHVHADNVLAATIAAYLNSSTKTSGADLRQHFTAPPFGWAPDLSRYVVAALFVDGRVALVDKSGIRHDNPRNPAVRAVLLAKEFATTRVAVEENPLTPAEATAVRELLDDLGEKTKDASELTLHDAARTMLQKLEKRLGGVERAKAVGLPLPVVFPELRSAIDEVTGAGSRSASLRSLIAHRPTFKEGDRATADLEQFIGAHGLEQYQRAERLAEIVLQAGLDDDPELGGDVREARSTIEELKTQQRVLAEWTGAFSTARETILVAYRTRYAPAYTQARERVEAARSAVMDSPEYTRLGEQVVQVRARFMSAGCPLQTIPDVGLKTELDLVNATNASSLPLLRARIDGAANAQAEAIALAAELAPDPAAAASTTWRTSTLVGKTFTANHEDEVDDVFDKAKAEIKALLRQGKTVRTL